MDAGDRLPTENEINWQGAFGEPGSRRLSSRQLAHRRAADRRRGYFRTPDHAWIVAAGKIFDLARVAAD
jgi:hypothetical protein